MRKPTTLADIERAHRLFRNHVAMAILDALSQGKNPSTDAGLGADKQAINDAVALLRQMDLVEPQPEAAVRSDIQPVTLTPRGRGLVEFLEGISRS